MHSTSLSTEDSEGKDSASDTAPAIGAVVALILIVVLIVTITIAVIALLKVYKVRNRASSIPTSTNLAYAVNQELTTTTTTTNPRSLSNTYEYPEMVRTPSMVYNAAYLTTNTCSARNPVFWADHQDASEEIISETSST